MISTCVIRSRIVCKLSRSKFLSGKESEHSKKYDVKSKDNHKICTKVVVHLVQGMYVLTFNANLK